MAPDDGRVVALTHGCGAHSETVVEAARVGVVRHGQGARRHRGARHRRRARRRRPSTDD
jgi:predicted alpha/beta-hydrolase family hydrolase